MAPTEKRRFGRFDWPEIALLERTLKTRTSQAAALLVVKTVATLKSSPEQGLLCRAPAAAMMSGMPMPPPEDVVIAGDMIRLGRLLKLAGLAQSGGEARELVQEGAVRVNGEVEMRRGRQLRRGELVEVGAQAVRVA